MAIKTHWFPSVFPAEHPLNKPMTWRFFWPVLILAYVLRLVFAQWADVMLHPDETFQYYEQAFRLIEGYGVTPWEYVFGIRSWFLPLCLAGLLAIADLFGLDQPPEYAFFVKSALCVISLALPVGMYRLGQQLWNEQAAILSLLLGCFWHHFLYVAHKPMPGIIAIYGLVWLVVWMLQPVTRARVFWFGLLLGVVFLLRYQLVPVLGLFWLVAVYRLRGVAIGALLMGNGVALALTGALDWYFWGGFLSSFIDNFRLNFLYDVASTFSERSYQYYVRNLTRETAGLFVIGAIALVFVWRQAWVIIAALIVGFIAFHIPAHKEVRFVLWIVPFALIGAAIITAWLASKHRLLWIGSPAVLFIISIGVSVQFSARYFGLVPWKSWARDGVSVVQALRETDGVTAVEFLTPSREWADMPGYYSLGKPVPLYMWGWHNMVSKEERYARLAHVSHIVAEAKMPIPEGYRALSQHGMYTLWESVTPKEAVGLDGFNLRTPYPTPIPRDYETIGTRTPLMVDGW